MKTFISFIMAAALAATAIPTLAGNLTPPGTPGAGSALPTLSDIYNQLATGATAAIPGSFQGPSAGPTGGTGRSLSEIKAKLPVADNTNGATAADVKAGKTFWGLRTDGTWGAQTGTSHTATSVCQTRWTGAICDVCTNGWSGANCDVAHPVVNKTGQTTSYATGDDGYYKYGIDPALAPTAGSTTGAYNTPALTNSPRFTDNGDCTVTDNQTSLIWMKNANCQGDASGYINWTNALTFANEQASGGACGQSDGSTAGQWRLPNINELHSLGPAWPPGAPFTQVQSKIDDFYWSSSSVDANSAWLVSMYDGWVSSGTKSSRINVWLVRSGQ